MKKDNKEVPRKKENKEYSKPVLKKFGQVQDLTKAMSTGTMSDGARWRACITPAPEVEEHRILLRDQVSQGAFQKSILETVKPGDVVLDLGTGSGIHAFFACQAGAKKVYAVDSSSIIELAKEVSRKNNYSDKIEFLLGEASEIELPEKVDVIITNIGFLNTFLTLPRIAEKHLKPKGKLIPSALELQFALAVAPNEYKEKVLFWEQEKFGLDFSAFKKIANNHPLYTVYQPEQIFSEPESLGHINMAAKPSEFSENEITLVAGQDGEVHGLAGWYNFWCGDIIFMSTKPPLKLEKDIWSEIFLPFEDPIFVKKGEHLKFKIGMYGNGSYAGPIWRWRGYRDGQEIINQCSFYATPLTPELLSKLQ